MMIEVRKVNKISLANVVGFFYGILGFFTSIIMSILVVFNIILQDDFVGSGAAVSVFNLGAALLLGLLMFVVVGAIGWVVGFVAGALYNFFAERAGGIKIGFKE